MAGYSGTPLVKKLGIKEHHRMLVINEPETYWDNLAPLPEGVEIYDKIPAGAIDFIHYFCLSAEKLKSEILELKSSLKKTGMLWISWPKKSSKVPTDLSDMIVRNTGLEAGLVDVKVCAVDSIWSGLKFVYRVSDR
ncbi:MULTISPECIES: DUF3052 domain-containing protein [Roseivirga]|uniref:DUF3052 domain-containing protein n=1 Tax=Roseivirga thermotolerans TaxID=1758176 RepID=A0ABQ3I6U1_9BACT|nr:MULTISPECIES: DUF3052 domain-containing protein [Roseivirga]MEC7754204.1 DUF3052 domain-containing protein [Bacteroidota bacterium]GHE60065.1 DUF3052 domain-containing protein [Roseivirga thermotolerans]|tara:strand:+ start:4793 stop:5200 length:408 start_codon:yes stop_codon:yes gene_type:complete